MKKEKITLEYLPFYNAFGISDKTITILQEKKVIPIISLKDEDYKKLGCPLPKRNTPTIGFLMCREPGHYTVDFNYAKAIAQSNINVRFLTYENNIKQMSGIDGLILPGGTFDSINEFYTDPLKKTYNKPGMRSWAYVTSIIHAKNKKLPMLGICAGAQQLGGMHGLKIFRNIKEYIDTKIEHNTKNLLAHEIRIKPNTPLYKIIGKEQIIVNSRHDEAIANGYENNNNIDIYALSIDGIPEAWGNEKENILCIQWHPEDFACQGDKAMQGIYDWIAEKARIYNKQKKLKKLKSPIKLIKDIIAQKNNHHHKQQT